MTDIGLVSVHVEFQRGLNLRATNKLRLPNIILGAAANDSDFSG